MAANARTTTASKPRDSFGIVVFVATAMLTLPHDTVSEPLLRTKVTKDMFTKWGFDKSVKLHYKIKSDIS